MAIIQYDKIIIKLLWIIALGVVLSGCGGGSSSSGGDTQEIVSTEGVNEVDDTSDSSNSIELTESLTSSYIASSTTKYYKAKLSPEESVTVIARSSEAKSRVLLYFSDQYLVSSCVVGQLTSTAHSCIGSTNEDGYVFFSVNGGEIGSEVIVDILQLRDDMHTPDAPLDISTKLPYTSQSNIYVTQDANGYNFIDGDALYIHSLTPGQHYKLRVVSPDLKAVLKVSDKKEDDFTFIDECTIIDTAKGISECEYPASKDGELFLSVEPVFGASITEYTLSLEIVKDQYTGIYDGTEEAPKVLNFTTDLPYNGGWIDTFTEAFYQIEGLTPSACYEAIIEHNETYWYSTIQVEDGLPSTSRSVGSADAEGILRIDVSMVEGTFILKVASAPINEGTEASPILTQDTSFFVQVADDFSWYQVTGLIADRSYDFAVLDKTNNSMVVHVNYGVDGLYTDENFYSHIADSEGKILIRVMGSNTEGAGGRANIQWMETP